MTVDQPLRSQELLRYAAISGRWEFDEIAATYLEGSGVGLAGGQPVSMGIALSNQSLQDGYAKVKVQFESLNPADLQGAGLVIGYRSPNERYLFAQLGASQSAYSIGEFEPGTGWLPIVTGGAKANLQPRRNYLLEMRMRGQR